MVALRVGRARPFLIVGWLFFLVTLVPVIGFVRIGSQALADRYTYIPSIGLFIALVFTVQDLTKQWRIGLVPVATLWTSVIALLSVLTARQISRWRDSETLFQYTLSVTSDNAVIHYNLGCLLQEQGRNDEAVSHFTEAVRIKPHYLHALANLGAVLRKQGKAAEAVGFYQRALALEPDSVIVRWQFGEVLEETGKPEAALPQFLEAVKLSPRDARLRTDLGVKLGHRNKFAEAAEQFKEALRIDPNNAEAHYDLGLVFLFTGQPEKALDEFTITRRLKPGVPGLEDSLRRAREAMKHP